AITLLPALLSVLGTRINALKLVPWRVGGPSPFWHALATRVMRHPWPFIVAVLAIAALIASPFRALHMTVPDATILPTSVQSRQGSDLPNSQFHQNQTNPVIVVVQAPGDLPSPTHMAALYDYAHRLARDPAVTAGGVDSLVTLSTAASRANYMQ